MLSTSLATRILRMVCAAVASRDTDSTCKAVMFAGKDGPTCAETVDRSFSLGGCPGGCNDISLVKHVIVRYMICRESTQCKCGVFIDKVSTYRSIAQLAHWPSILQVFV